MALDFDSARLPDPNLREEHEAWRSTLRRFVDSEVMPYVDAWDEQGEVPLDLWAKAAAIGLLPLGYP
ncbi:MAG: acyl-CoA dehydrogenase family protein, partial [Gammaproteobacteria bacterium]